MSPPHEFRPEAPAFAPGRPLPEIVVRTSAAPVPSDDVTEEQRIALNPPGRNQARTSRLLPIPEHTHTVGLTAADRGVQSTAHSRTAVRGESVEASRHNRGTGLDTLSPELAALWAESGRPRSKSEAPVMLSHSRASSESVTSRNSSPSKRGILDYEKLQKGTELRVKKQNYKAMHSPSEAKVLDNLNAAFNNNDKNLQNSQIGARACTDCNLKPSHKLWPCQHTVCYHHILYGPDTDSHTPVYCGHCQKVKFSTTPVQYQYRSKLTVRIQSVQEVHEVTPAVQGPSTGLATAISDQVWPSSVPVQSPAKGHLTQNMNPLQQGTSWGHPQFTSQTPVPDPRLAQAGYHAMTPPLARPETAMSNVSYTSQAPFGPYGMPPQRGVSLLGSDPTQNGGLQYGGRQDGMYRNIQQHNIMQQRGVDPRSLPMGPPMGPRMDPGLQHGNYMPRPTLPDPFIDRQSSVYNGGPAWNRTNDWNPNFAPYGGRNPGQVQNFALQGGSNPGQVQNFAPQGGSNQAQTQNYGGPQPFAPQTYTGPPNMSALPVQPHPNQSGNAAGESHSQEYKASAAALAQAIKAGMCEDSVPSGDTPSRPPWSSNRGRGGRDEWMPQQPMRAPVLGPLVVPPPPPPPSFRVAPHPPFFEKLAQGHRPTLEEAIEHVPFQELCRYAKPVSWGVIKVMNIPYGTTKNEIVAAVGRNARLVSQPPGSPYYAIHIIMERSTGKTMDCY
ncbi:hypothetical protein LTR28_006413, partial [Elasticomyces elasticus]